MVWGIPPTVSYFHYLASLLAIDIYCMDEFKHGTAKWFKLLGTEGIKIARAGKICMIFIEI